MTPCDLVWSFLRSSCIPYLSDRIIGPRPYAAPVFPLAHSFAHLACSPRLIYTLFHATYSFRSALKMEAAPSYETLVALPVYTALLVASSVLPWELQTVNSSINLLSQMTGLQNTDFARCNIVKCKRFWKIPVFRDMKACRSVVTEVSEELTCSIFRVQLVQEAWNLPTESDDLRYILTHEVSFAAVYRCDLVLFTNVRKSAT